MKTFDVRDFGAKGDGVTNDAPAIQAAIDAAAAYQDTQGFQEQWQAWKADQRWWRRLLVRLRLRQAVPRPPSATVQMHTGVSVIKEPLRLHGGGFAMTGLNLKMQCAHRGTICRDGWRCFDCGEPVDEPDDFFCPCSSMMEAHTLGVHR